MIATFQNMIAACGSKAHLMRRALVFSFLSAVTQGLAYALIFPLFAALIDASDDVWQYFGAIVAS